MGRPLENQGYSTTTFKYGGRSTTATGGYCTDKPDQILPYKTFRLPHAGEFTLLQIFGGHEVPVYPHGQRRDLLRPWRSEVGVQRKISRRIRVSIAVGSGSLRQLCSSSLERVFGIMELVPAQDAYNVIDTLTLEDPSKLRSCSSVIPH